MDTLRSEGVFLYEKALAPTLMKMHPLLLKVGAKFLMAVVLKIAPKSCRVHLDCITQAENRLKPLIRLDILLRQTIKPADNRLVLLYQPRLTNVAGAEGLEPSTRGFGDRCSTN